MSESAFREALRDIRGTLTLRQADTKTVATLSDKMTTAIRICDDLLARFPPRPTELRPDQKLALNAYQLACHQLDMLNRQFTPSPTERAIIEINLGRASDQCRALGLTSADGFHG